MLFNLPTLNLYVCKLMFYHIVNLEFIAKTIVYILLYVK